MPVLRQHRVGSLDRRPCSSDRLETLGTGRGRRVRALRLLALPGGTRFSEIMENGPEGREERAGWAGGGEDRPNVALRLASDVAMMQATDFGNRDDRASSGGSMGRPSCASLSSER